MFRIFKYGIATIYQQQFYKNSLNWLLKNINNKFLFIKITKYFYTNCRAEKLQKKKNTY